ncbi:vitelline membrane protein Vm26Ab-like [Anopheles ziemanni]|uniref:vitelline membrane protein Vm26Ab-like n=1 Tax=Anopheles coustani TaxID=139045 RepID=UPI00265826E8|nr:vitelline membrane protein Vm26Ab-like [Anopheles coustani]XP_058166478.1 vitelline membrane protein Vm26Ab-like [Anopheles ziemanni]
MFAKVFVFVAIAVGCAAGKPLTAAVVAAPAVVTAQSSQVIARNYNGVAPAVVSAAYTAPVAAAYTAPVAAAYTAPVAAAYTAYSAPFGAAYTAPVAAAYSAPLAAAYTASPYASYYPYVL